MTAPQPPPQSSCCCILGKLTQPFFFCCFVCFPLFPQFYLQARFTWKGARLLRPLLQFTLIMMAFYTGLSRVSDHKHHPTDVLAGFAQGALVAYCVVSVENRAGRALGVLGGSCGSSSAFATHQFSSGDSLLQLGMRWEAAWSGQLGALQGCSVKGEYFPLHQQLWLVQLFSVRLVSKVFHQELNRESGVVGIMAVPHTVHPKTGGLLDEGRQTAGGFS